MPRPTDNPLVRRLAGSRAPTDFTRRSVKTKIFMYLALLMLVLAAAERARDPKSWQWLADMDKWQEPEKITNRLTPPPPRTPIDDPHSFVTSDAPPAESLPEKTPAAEAPVLDPVERAWQQGWKEVLERLEDSDRSLLFEVLYDAERHQALDPKKHDTAAAAVETAHRLWEDYAAAAFQSLVTLSPEDQLTWVDVLRQVNHRWSEDVRPSLAAVIDGRTPTENEEILLARFQQTLDELALRRIEDDTLFLRPAERDIWLRLQAKARDADPAKLRRESLGQVSYLQLFKQPGDYRGKPITVRGTAKYAYRVQAADNYLGVKDHFVLWVSPVGGPSSPIVVYALDIPPGFPKIEANSAGDMTKLDEEVTVTGFFLKRGAYLGKDGTYTAPLVLASVPEWHPREVALTDTSRFSLGPNWLLPSVVAALVISLLIFGVVWWRLRQGEAESRAVAAMAAAAKEPLNVEQLSVAATPHEALRALEEQERGRT
jgi:hypothetical protein